MQSRLLLRPFTVALSLTSVCALAQSAPPRVAVPAPWVLSVLHQQGLELSPAQLRLQAPVLATTASPALHVQKADLAADGELRIRMACDSPAICLPFLALAIPQSVDASAAFVARFASSSLNGLPVQGGGEGRLRVGQHVTLLLSDHFMRITLPAVSLDAGGNGQQVRVTTLDHRQTFLATVSEPGTVEVALP